MWVSPALCSSHASTLYEIMQVLMPCNHRLLWQRVIATVNGHRERTWVGSAPGSHLWRVWYVQLKLEKAWEYVWNGYEIGPRVPIGCEEVSLLVGLCPPFFAWLSRLGVPPYPPPPNPIHKDMSQVHLVAQFGLTLTSTCLVLGLIYLVIIRLSQCTPSLRTGNV